MTAVSETTIAVPMAVRRGAIGVLVAGPVAAKVVVTVPTVAIVLVMARILVIEGLATARILTAVVPATTRAMAIESAVLTPGAAIADRAMVANRAIVPSRVAPREVRAAAVASTTIHVVVALLKRVLSRGITTVLVLRLLVSVILCPKACLSSLPLAPLALRRFLLVSCANCVCIA